MSQGELRFKIELDEGGSTKKAQKFNQTIKKTGEESEKTEKSYKSMIKQIACCGGVLIAAKKAIDFVGDSIGLASDAMEEHSKLQTVFSNSIEKTGAAIKNLTDNFGYSTLQAERMFAATGDLLSGFGFNEKAMFGLSNETQKLAADLASFTNIEGGAAQASIALTKLLVGETEPAKQLGIVVRQDTKEFKGMVKELERTQGMTLLQAKAVTSLKIAMSQSKLAMGDFSRTQGSFANQAKILKNTIEDLKVEFGKVFVEVLLPLLRDFSGWMKENKDTIVSGFVAIGKAAEFAVGPVRALAMLTELFDQSAEAEKRAIQQTEDLTRNYASLRQAMRMAGIKAGELNEAIKKTPGGKRIEELKKKVSEYNDVMARNSKVGAVVSNMEKKIAETQKEIKSIRMESIQAIFQTSGAYGIEAERIEAARAALMGHMQRVDEFKAKRTGQLSAETEGQKALNVALTEAQRIAESYGVSLKAANEIIKAQNPELQKIKALQKELGGSLQEARVVYKEVNRLEKEREKNLKMMKKPLSDNLDLNVDLSESIRGVLDSMDELEAKQSELSTGFESEYIAAVENMTDVSAGAPPEIDRVRDAIEMAAKAGKQELFSGFQGVTGIFESLGVEVPGGAKKIAGGIGDIASGIMSKNPIKVIEGVIGSVSGLIDLFSGDGIQEAMDRENGWMDLSEGLSDQIHELAEEIGDTHAATSLMFSDILDETELTTENFSKYVDRQREILIDMDNGLISHQEAIEEIGDTWTTLVEEAERLNTEGSAEMIETLRNLRNRGEEVAEIQEYVNAQLDQGLTHLQDYTKESADAAREIIILEKEINSMTLGSTEFQEANKRLNELRTGFADIANQDEFNDAISYTMGFMQAFQKEGLSMFDIIERMGPSIENLQDLADVGGFQTGGLTELLGLREFMEENQKTFQGIEQTKGMLEALGNTAYLTADTFGTMQQDTLDYYNQLSKDPEDRLQALQAVAPLLAKELWYAEQNNLELDEKTKKLIEAAEKEGVNIKNQIPFQERQTQLMESQLEVMTALAAVFGVVLPGSIDNATEAMRDFEKQVGNVGKRQRELENMSMGTGGAGAGGAGATPGMGTTTPAPALTPGLSNNRIPGFADGTDGWLQITQPTAVMVGEGGEPEYMNVIPQSDLTTQNLSGLTDQIATVDGAPQVSDFIQVGTGAGEVTAFFSSELPQAIASTTGAMIEMDAAAGVVNITATETGASVADKFKMSSGSMVDAFISGSQESAAAVDAFADLAIKRVSEFNEVMTGSINADLNIRNAQPGPTPAPLTIPGFANGTPAGGLIVPPGFNDDNYIVGLNSGERLTVDNGRNQTQASPVVIESLNVNVFPQPGDSVEDLVEKLKIAIQNDIGGLVREMNIAGVGQNGQ